MAEKNPSGEGRVTGLGDLRGKQGAHRGRKRVGRGPGSGMGKTSGRGHKGAKARSGNRKKPGYEGGQMPLQRRLPKRGFRNIFGKEFSEVNVGRLGRFDAGSTVDAAALCVSGLVSKLARSGVKLLGSGAIDRALQWLYHKQILCKGDWAVKCPGVEPGGWAFQFQNDFYPDNDDSA
ncbi:MAG: 50S ribosomal protein L15, partial [Nitrospinota bacterium]